MYFRDYHININEVIDLRLTKPMFLSIIALSPPVAIPEYFTADIVSMSTHIVLLQNT